MIRALVRLWQRIFRHQADEKAKEYAEATLYRLRRRVQALETLRGDRG